MQTRISGTTAAAAMFAFICVGPLRAHHSSSMFDLSTPIWVKGTVLRYEPISPHAMIELEETNAEGQVQRWLIEGPFPGRLKRILSFQPAGSDEKIVQVGDMIEICGFALRDEVASQKFYADASVVSRRFVHGHVIVMPDGRMQSWGPYGKIDNCVRASDRTQSWLEFLNADPLAREFWCRASVRAPSVAPKAFIDEVNGLIAGSCP